MSEQQTPSPEQEQILTPQDMQAANNRNRRSASRPGWIAVVAALVFFGGLAAFMFHF